MLSARRTAALTMAVLVAAGSAVAAPLDPSRYDQTFRKYSKRYFGPAFDWRLFKAQAMAESSLRPTAQSWAGARGVMQLMPATYQEIQSKNPEIIGTWDHPEWNIAAGIAYSRQLWTAWTNDSIVDDLRQFVLSSYNAGRVTLRRAQKVAEERKLNPRAWPDIETVAPNVPRWRHSETLTYVSRVLGNLAGMDSQGRLTERPSAGP
jgi:membrane-bound lytic murein transglycosylase MltF